MPTNAGNKILNEKMKMFFLGLQSSIRLDEVDDTCN